MNSNTSHRPGALLDASTTPKNNEYGSIASNSINRSNKNNNSPAYPNRDSNLVSRWSSQRHPNLSAPDDNFDYFNPNHTDSNLVSRWSSQRHPNLSAPDDNFDYFNPNHTVEPDNFMDSAHDFEMVPCNHVVVQLHPFQIFVRITLQLPTKKHTTCAHIDEGVNKSALEVVNSTQCQSSGNILHHFDVT
eukprot:CAMPEP_0171323948 /NCGR_PEP_ID=MMETSP0816-20121228/115890_1 /TAXON_ID=420281 /ORGANISM="Proboscia inermis, Strain CCAP1064/1" /LENGTH=188 /DNA_ID=CAMNT_0011822777 /DNA_START=159 /DNA_END=725 /DNA_ORIENTATION=+